MEKFEAVYHPVDPAIFNEARVFESSPDALPVFPLRYLRADVAVFYAQEPDRKKQLRDFVTQTLAVMKICKRTGMYFIETFYIEEYEVACFSLRERLDLSPSEIEGLGAATRTKMAKEGII